MTRLLLIHAGPTPWDAENRVVGANSLPLTEDARIALAARVGTIAELVDAIYTCDANEACKEAAGMLEEKFGVRVRDKPELGEVRLGLWEGMTRDELEHRFETVFPMWNEQPLAVTPPDGESLPEAIDRMRPVVRKIVRRHRGGVVAIVLRPLAMQIVAGLLRGEDPPGIAAHLHGIEMMETMELSDEQVESII